MSREELLQAVWPGMVVTEHALSRCIYQLRVHLHTAGGRPHRNVLETLPKRGYRLNCQPAPVCDGAAVETRGSGEIQPAFNDARLALAWAHLERGEPAAALALLEPSVEQCKMMEIQERLHRGDHLASRAVVALLTGHEELALERLTRAGDSGWSQYYKARTLPWFRELEAEPASRVLIARAEAVIKEQRALIEAANATDDFEARLQAALSAAAGTVR